MEKTKNNSNKRLILAAVFVVALVAGMAIVYFATRPSVSQGSKTITVEVTHSDGSHATFEYHTDVEYLGEVLLAEGLIGGDGASAGLFTIVDGEAAVWADNGAYWALYENGDYAEQGVNTTPVTDGGSYALVYTIG